MNLDICITRAVGSSLKAYGVECLARWTLSVARRRLRQARRRSFCHA